MSMVADKGPARAQGVLGVALTPRSRRVAQALSYELVAIALVTPAIAWVFGQGHGSALGLSVLMSSIALAWVLKVAWA